MTNRWRLVSYTLRPQSTDADVNGVLGPTSLDVSYKPIPPVPATSSSGWTPLLRAHLGHIQPTVDRWRGTLDTLLVFVSFCDPSLRIIADGGKKIALFSAIVTTFFIQSLTGLSQDTGARTNELLQNLTDIFIAVNGADASQLNVSSPVPFEPESSAVRLNFYWSISLILSVRPLFHTHCSWLIAVSTTFRSQWLPLQ